MPEEHAIVGWKDIAKMFNIHPQTMMRKRDELIEAGAIYYMMKGRPPYKTVCAFPSVLKAWIALKARKGELL